MSKNDELTPELSTMTETPKKYKGTLPKGF